MPFITVGRENSAAIRIYYEDRGSVQPALQSPVIGGSFLRIQAVEEENTSLTPQVRQVVILAVGAVWRSAYELYVHSAVARSIGLPDQVVRALTAGQMPGDVAAAQG
jgi:4-carboxymuconolactone decarboxylase